jgi:ABC-2 type transport system ATP-binding protein
MTSVEPMIVAKNLSRQYRVQKDALNTGRFGFGLARREMETVDAIKSISFTVNKAEAVGLIGLNGAGKSTLLKLVTGVLVPSSGELTVDGLDPSADRKKVAREIGVVFGHRSQLWWDAPLKDSMEVLRLIYSVGKADYERRLSDLVELLQLGDLILRAPRQISLGQRVRGEILASLLHSPKLLILDEPTVGLDIIAKARIRTLIRSLIDNEGVTVILASHEVSDIEEICERTILIHEGEILYEGTIDELKSGADVERSLVLDVSVPADDGSDGVEVREMTVPLTGGNTAAILEKAASSGTVSDARVTGGSLEAILSKMFDKITS